MKRSVPLAIILVFFTRPEILFSGPFGPPDGEKRVIPPLEFFGEMAEAFDFQHRPKDSEQMSETGLFDPKGEQKIYEVNIKYKGFEVIREHGEFLLRMQREGSDHSETFKKFHRMRSDRPFAGSTISPLNDKGTHQYYFIERENGDRKHASVEVQISNLSFTYLSNGLEDPRAEVEQFLEKYVAFLLSKIANKKPAIPERVWTSSGGKEMNGSVLFFDAAKNTISFRRFDGKVYPAMSLDLLSEEDQLVIRKELDE